MNTKLIAEIALTHLFTKKKQTIIAMLGVTFGISMFIVMISFMTGVNQFMEDMAMDNTPHIHIYNPIQLNGHAIVEPASTETKNWVVLQHQRPKNVLPKIKNGMQVAAEIAAMPGVKGVVPSVTTQVFFNNGPVQIPGTISGVDVRKQDELYLTSGKMEEGNWDDLLKGTDVIVMGHGLAVKASVKVGDRISLTTPQGANHLVKVVGIFSYGISMLDDSKSYASLATVQKLVARDPSYVTDLNVKMNVMDEAAAFKTTLRKVYPNLYMEDWQEANASLLAGESIRNIMTFVISFTLLIVAGFGIYNIMNMNIISKMKDIAILKATGFESPQIVSVFLLESLIIGILGAGLGLLIGFGISYLLSITPFPAGQFVRINTFPVNFLVKHYLMGVSFGFVTTLIAGYMPALKAAKIDPVKIIRG